MRSRTAAHVFKSYTVDTQYCGTDSDSHVPCTQDMIDKCDIIVCMEDQNYWEIVQNFDLNGRPIKTLGLPDEYDYMDDGLIQLLKIALSKNGILNFL